MNETLLLEHGNSNEEFREQKRRKSNASDSEAKSIKKAAKQTTGARVTHELPTRNFFAPLRTAGMDLDPTEDTNNQTDGEQQPPNSQRGRSPPIIFTSTINLIQLQKQLKSLVKGNFKFRNTRNGTRIVTKEMADYSAVKEYLNFQNLNYVTFYPKSLKPIKAVIRHLPGNKPAEEIYEGLVELGFDIISVKQMSTTHRSQGSSTSLPLFLITLPWSEKPQEIYKLTSLCYIAIKVDLYKSHSGLTQCRDCQQFGHVWANCRQHPRCMWYEGGHLHR
jgi:hypothetical protein